jgi:hypothetical protein
MPLRIFPFGWPRRDRHQTPRCFRFISPKQESSRRKHLWSLFFQPLIVTSDFVQRNVALFFVRSASVPFRSVFHKGHTFAFYGFCDELHSVFPFAAVPRAPRREADRIVPSSTFNDMEAERGAFFRRSDTGT